MLSKREQIIDCDCVRESLDKKKIITLKESWDKNENGREILENVIAEEITRKK